MSKPATDVQSLMDRVSIEDIHTQYFQGLDQQDAEKVRSCFDKNVEMVYDKLPSVRGVDAFMKEIIGPFFESTRTANPRYGQVRISNHFMGNLRFNLLQADQAETETYVLSMSVRGIDGKDLVFVRSLRYLDRFRRTSEGWRITKRVQALDWSSEVSPSFATTIAARVNSV